MTSSRTHATTTIRHDSPAPRRGKNLPAGVLLAVVLLLAIAFLLLKSGYSLRGPEQGPAAVRGGKK